MSPVRKHCHSLTCIPSKPSFCLREVEVQHTALKFTCAPSQKTPAAQITSIKHCAFAHKIRPRSTTMQNTVLCITKRRTNNYNKMLHLWQKQWHYFNKKVMSDVPIKLSCVFPVLKFQYRQIVLLQTYFILSRNQESLSKTYSTSPETLQVKPWPPWDRYKPYSRGHKITTAPDWLPQSIRWLAGE